MREDAEGEEREEEEGRDDEERRKEKKGKERESMMKIKRERICLRSVTFNIFR